MARKPKVNEQTWRRIYHSPDNSILVFSSDTTDCYYKVTTTNSRPKYFYGEMAWADCQRYVVDSGDFGGWSIFN